MRKQHGMRLSVRVAVLGDRTKLGLWWVGITGATASANSFLAAGKLGIRGRPAHWKKMK